MENIYLDTSIFVKENFLEGQRIKTFFELFANSRFQLVMSVIAVNEVKNQFKKSVKIAIQAHNELLNQRTMSPLRNIPQSEVRSTKFPKLEVLCESFNKLFDEKLEAAKVEIIPYPTLNIEEIFIDYFGSKFPFNTADKKNEFPDAFALTSLVTWCKEKKQTCTVFSKDKDFLNFKSKQLDINDNYETFLDEYLKLESGRMAILETLVNENEELVNRYIKAWLDGQLDDTSLYYEHSNYLEVHDIVFEKLEIEDKNYTVISIDKDEITIEMKAEVYLEVDIVIDDEETGYYDSDDRDWHYFETTTRTIDQHASIPLILVFQIIDNEDYDPEAEIVEINNDQKFKLRKPRYDR